MKTPEPKDILEELGDDVVEQIGRGAVISFEGALAAMTDYHSFLIAAHATRDTEGRVFNLAQIPGFFQPPHAEWVGQYNRLFVKAVSVMDAETAFVRHLVHVPRRLLPNDATQTSSALVMGILDLALYFVHRLETWVTNNSWIDLEGDAKRVGLGGLQRRVYEDVLRNWIGAWETINALASHYYKWDAAGGDETEQWRRFRDSLPLLLRHLRNTAYLLTVAVWNEDAIGAEFYAECLMRWPTSIRNTLTEEFFVKTTFLTVDLLEAEWPEAAATIPLHVPAAFHPVTPKGIFAAILDNTCADTIAITIEVMLRWKLLGRHPTGLPATIVNLLLANASNFEGNPRRRSRDHPQLRTLLDHLRIESAVDDVADQGYAGWLNDLAKAIDGHTEGAVVPGRIFAPSTLWGRNGLEQPALLLLLTTGSQARVGLTAVTPDTIWEYAETFLKGDRTLRAFLFHFDRLLSEFQSGKSDLERVFNELRPDEDYAAASASVMALLTTWKSGIVERRRRNMLASAIDAGKLMRMRADADRLLMDGGPLLSIFRDFTIDQAIKTLEKRSYPIQPIGREFFAIPPMADSCDEYLAHFPPIVQEYAANLVWTWIGQLPKRRIQAPTAELYWEAMKVVGKAMTDVGLSPVLLIGNVEDAPWVTGWLSEDRRVRPVDMDVRHKSGEVARGYMNSINEFDVFVMQLPPGVSVIIAREIVERIVYQIDEQNRIGRIVCRAMADRTKVACEFSFGQSVELRQQSVVELVYSEQVGPGAG